MPTSHDSVCSLDIILRVVWPGLAHPLRQVGPAVAQPAASGISGAITNDTGAAAGLVNVAHQLGGSLGLGILVAAFAAASSGPANDRAPFTHRVGTSLTPGTAMVTLALVLDIALVILHNKCGRISAGAPSVSGRQRMTARSRIWPEGAGNEGARNS